MFFRFLLSISGLFAAYTLLYLLNLIIQELRSPLRHVPGPKTSKLANFFYGQINDSDTAQTLRKRQQWVEQYGPTLKYRGFLGFSRLYTQDTKAINHVLMHPYTYQKPESTRYNLSRIVGPGLLVVEADVHKQQRRVMNPAFGYPQVRELTPIFTQKGNELRNIWAAQTGASKTVRVDILAWLNKATLDIIGLAGFNYDFNSLASENQSELAEAFNMIFKSGVQGSPIRILQTQLPAFRFIKTSLDRVMDNSQAVMKRIGSQLLQNSKNEIAHGGSSDSTRSRDLLSLLVRANTSKDIPVHQRLTDEDVLAQVPTFLVAGHETTSTATTWCLFALAQNKPAQTRLRNELLAMDTDEPSMDELNALSYLECVVKESLRVYSPVPSTTRVATQDDVVPLAKPFTDTQGNVHETLRVKKGQAVMIPIMALNHDKEIWGPDAAEFKPERWEQEKAISNSIPGIWSHILSFSGGPRACIGYRFSLVEMKALLFTLVRNFEFDLALAVAEIGSRSSVVQRPYLRSEPTKENQLPLLIKAYAA
ncbi:cytochrome P450 [Favolaschia claudopus]|uniref:Cytochrome P450 n=1 Tax=Favolaschia claudopus TaxID=2862362 RepID=A0AAW0DKM9_9AGAR